MKRIIISIFFMLVLGVNNNSIYAQSVTKQGDKYIKESDFISTGKIIKTPYIYRDSKGRTYPVYLSQTGKAFIKMKSPKNGKMYKQYLPEVGRQINPSAYKNRPK